MEDYRRRQWMRCYPRVLFCLAVPALYLPTVNAVADAPTPHICGAAEFHQFDFLQGEWTVTDAQGQKVGVNSIRAIVDGCALQEDWRGGDGEHGSSLIFFDINLQQWYQTWIDNRGSSLRLKGGLIDGRMVLGGIKDNTPEIHEISWMPLNDGRIRQYWRMSTDNGKTWVERFSGYYNPLP